MCIFVSVNVEYYTQMLKNGPIAFSKHLNQNIFN